jgi:hypothetical protein
MHYTTLEPFSQYPNAFPALAADLGDSCIHCTTPALNNQAAPV